MAGFCHNHSWDLSFKLSQPLKKTIPAFSSLLCKVQFKTFFQSRLIRLPWRLQPKEVSLAEIVVLAFEALKLNSEPTDFSFVNNGWQCIAVKGCVSFATCMQPYCTNITDTGVFHEIIIMLCLYGFKKVFFLKFSLQGNLDITLFCICHSRLFHTCSEQRYYSVKEELSLLVFKNISVKTFSY